MKVVIIVCLISLTSAFYTDVDESINIDENMSNPEKLKPYMDCFLDRGPCSKSAASYKNHFFDFLSNACKNCDDKLKHIAEEFLLNLCIKYPDDMAILRSKYDPSGTNFAKLAFEVSKY